MTRGLLRGYLYIMFTMLVAVFGVALGFLLYAVLSVLLLTQQLPSWSFGALIAVLVAVAIGLPHYQGIQRDLAEDPSAADSLARSMTLNLIQAVAALIAFFGGAIAIMVITPPSHDPAQFVRFLPPALAALAVFWIVQYVRAQARTTSGASLVVQRLFLYGPQTLIVFIVTYFLIPDLLVGEASNGWHQISQLVGSGLPPYNPGVFLDVVWGIAAWLVYAWLVRSDTGSRLRLVAQYIGFGLGVGCFIVAFRRLVFLNTEWFVVCKPIVPGVDADCSLNISTDLYTPLLVSLLLLVGYGVWLLSDAGQNRLGIRDTALVALALAAGVFGWAFYVGVARTLIGIVATITASKNPNLSPNAWLASGFSLLGAGLLHLVWPYILRRRGITGKSASGPRQAYLLGGLAGGLLFAGVYAVSALSNLGLGTVLGNIPTALNDFWIALTRCTGSTCAPPTLSYVAGITILVGLYIALIHFWRARAEHVFQPGPIPARPSEVTARSILESLRSGNITQEEAMVQLRALVDSVEPAPKP
jgi:hypothetical protein